MCSQIWPPQRGNLKNLGLCFDDNFIHRAMNFMTQTPNFMAMTEVISWRGIFTLMYEFMSTLMYEFISEDACGRSGMLEQACAWYLRSLRIKTKLARTTGSEQRLWDSEKSSSLPPSKKFEYLVNYGSGLLSEAFPSAAGLHKSLGPIYYGYYRSVD